MKNKIEWKPCAVRGTQGNGAHSQSFLWLDYGTGGRKPSPRAEKWLHTRSGWWREAVKSFSGCVWDPPVLMILGRQRRDLRWPCIQAGVGVGAATVTIFQVYRQIKSAWRNVCCTNIRSLTENSVCSTPIFSIQVPRSLQLCLKEVSRQGLLSAGCQ